MGGIRPVLGVFAVALVVFSVPMARQLVDLTSPAPAHVPNEPAQAVLDSPGAPSVAPIEVPSLPADVPSPTPTPIATPTLPPVVVTPTPTAAKPLAQDQTRVEQGDRLGAGERAGQSAGVRTLRMPILMYHYVRVNPDPADRIGFGLSVTPADFARQLDLFAALGYQTIGLDELTAYLRGEDTSLPSRPIVLSFDDGYADFYSAAYPLLKERGFRATIFMVSAFVDRPGYLSWTQLKELAANGMTIGAHTVNHPDLTLLNKNELAWQLESSKAALERELGRPVHHFSYPSGRYDDKVLAAVRAAGYRAAVTVKHGLTHRPDDLLTLDRVRVSGGQSLTGLATLAGLEPALVAPPAQ